MLAAMIPSHAKLPESQTYCEYFQSKRPLNTDTTNRETSKEAGKLSGIAYDPELMRAVSEVL